MFTKFKKGDSVVLLSDLGTERKVISVFKDRIGDTVYTLCNKHSYEEFEITYYSRPVSIIAGLVSGLRKALDEKVSFFQSLVDKNNNALKKENETLKKELKDLREEVFGGEKTNTLQISNYSYLMQAIYGDYTKPKTISLSEKLNKIEEFLKIKYETKETKEAGYKPIKVEKKVSKKKAKK